jgi:hypothetical protein
MVKTPTAWSSNPSSETAEYAYDSATDPYDSATLNYDGVVDADLADTERTPTEWTEA